MHPWVDYLLATRTFNLWMSKGAHGIFAIVVNFILSALEAKHVIIRLSKVTNTIGIAMILKLQKLLYKFFFTTKILAYAKDKGSNLQTCANGFIYVTLCGVKT